MTGGWKVNDPITWSDKPGGGNPASIALIWGDVKTKTHLHAHGYHKFESSLIELGEDTIDDVRKLWDWMAARTSVKRDGLAKYQDKLDRCDAAFVWKALRKQSFISRDTAVLRKTELIKELLELLDELRKGVAPCTAARTAGNQLPSTNNVEELVATVESALAKLNEGPKISQYDAQREWMAPALAKLHSVIKTGSQAGLSTTLSPWSFPRSGEAAEALAITPSFSIQPLESLRPQILALIRGEPSEVNPIESARTRPTKRKEPESLEEQRQSSSRLAKRARSTQPLQDVWLPAPEALAAETFAELTVQCDCAWNAAMIAAGASFAGESAKTKLCGPIVNGLWEVAAQENSEKGVNQEVLEAFNSMLRAPSLYFK